MKFLNILKANAQITELTAKVEDLTKQVDQLKAENETLKQQQATYSLGAQDWAAEKEVLVKQHEDAMAELIEDYEVKMKVAHSSAAKQASDIVASIGVEMDTVKVTSAPTENDIVAKFQRMSGKEQQEFYKANREVIVKTLGFKMY